MDAEEIARIRQSAAYRTLLTRRTRLSWILTGVMLAVYFGYIGLIAFDKAVLAHPIGVGVTSAGILAGIGLIVFTIALMMIYVWRANSQFDVLTRAVSSELRP